MLVDSFSFIKDFNSLSSFFRVLKLIISFFNSLISLFKFDISFSYDSHLAVSSSSSNSLFLLLYNNSISIKFSLPAKSKIINFNFIILFFSTSSIITLSFSKISNKNLNPSFRLSKNIFVNFVKSFIVSLISYLKHLINNNSSVLLIEML